jgi:hypothetical protein
MWHFSVGLANGGSITVNHPGNVKPPVTLTGDDFKWAWEYLGRYNSSVWEHNALRDIWCYGSGFWVRSK